MIQMKTIRAQICVLCGCGLLIGSISVNAADWRDLTPREKDRIQRNYQRWEKLPPQDKNNLRKEWERYQRLPPDERERIKQRYESDRRRR